VHPHHNASPVGPPRRASESAFRTMQSTWAMLDACKDALETFLEVDLAMRRTTAQARYEELLAQGWWTEFNLYELAWLRERITTEQTGRWLERRA
jgi:hypothetical protein